jgi:hypothetical protein
LGLTARPATHAPLGNSESVGKDSGLGLASVRDRRDFSVDRPPGTVIQLEGSPYDGLAVERGAAPEGASRFFEN